MTCVEITIEIGDDDFQKQIRNELDILLGIAQGMEQSLNQSLNISQVLVPLDFETKIRELTGRDDYKFQRGSEDAKITVMAKILEDENGVVIVISPWLYVPNLASLFDTMVRSFILSHELAHVMNKKRLPKVPQELSAAGSYLGSLYYMFDEYFADRFSYRLTEKIFTPTEAWQKFNDNNVLRYINPESHPSYYAEIKSENSGYMEMSIYS